MNQVIELMMNHKSVRKFTNEPISQEVVHAIVEAAQMAPTSTMYQAYSIISITDEAVKSKLAKINNQAYTKDNGHLFVFCADMFRLYEAVPDKEAVQVPIESTENLIVAVADASLAAQNAVIAAESLGLGTVFLGSIRNDIEQVNELLDLPQYVIPLFALAIGIPDPNNQVQIKPRLPKEAVHFTNQYRQDTKELIHAYDNTMEAYLSNRGSNARVDNWSNSVFRSLQNKSRLDVGEFVRKKGLNRND